MTTDENLFNVDPYYDDYSDSKKFLKVLFRPGFAVQGRELTQAQTIVNKQIKRFGDNIFKDGSIVSESQVVLNQAQFVRVSGLTGYSGVSIADFDGLTAAVSGKNTVRVIDTLSGLTGSNVESDHSILIFSEYLQGTTGFALGDTIRANFDGVTISGVVTGGTSTYNYYGGAPSSLPAFGDASLIGLDSGVRYIKGYFVNHDLQKLTAYNVTGSGSNTYRQFNNLNSTLYLGVTDSIITSLDDSTLNDPAYGSYNYAAPGADRYRIDLTLSQASLTATSPYTLMNIENGEVTYKVDSTEYNILADTLARRTYDESGNYTVDDFPISVDDHATDETKLSVKIGKGKAYIFGKEFVNFANKTLTLDKPRTYKSISAQDVPTVLGNEVSLAFSTTLTAPIVSNIDFNNSPRFFISSGTAGDPFTRVGTTRLGRFNAIDGGTKANLYDFILDAGYTSGSAKRLFYPGYTATNQHVFTFSTSPVEITKTNYNSLLFPLSQDVNAYAVPTVNSQEFKVQRVYKLYLTGTTQVITTQDFSPDWAASTYQEFNSINDLKIYGLTGVPVSYTAMFSGNTRTISLTAGSSGFTANIFASIKINTSTDFRRNKTLTTVGHTSVSMRTSSFEEYAYLNGAVDANSILGITGEIGGVSGINMSTYFTLDTGQRDDLYDWSRIVLKPQYMGLGATGISVKFTKFARSSSPSNGCGPFFADSYTSVGITGTPVYTFKGRSGRVVSLGGCYDFRPDRIAPTSLSTTDTPDMYGATGVAQLNDVNLTVGWNAYLPRTDKIVLSKDKQFSVIEGVDSEQALAPEDSPDAMTIATVFMNPYTKSAVDTKKYIIKNRRYTMKDIGKIDKRVERLEYYTTLSLQEKDAKTLQIQDANGLNKFKNGIFVDDFTSRSNSSYNSSDHSCSVDPEKKEIRPRFTAKYIDFGLTGTVPSTLTANSDGIVMLNHTEEIFLNQSLASKSVNVNPFNVTNFNGTLTITPESDDWVDVTTRPSVLVNLSGENDGIADTDVIDFGTIWNNWESNWTGRTVGSTPWNFIDNSPAHSLFNQSGTWTPANGNAVFVTAQQSTRTVTGQKITLSPETVTRNIGDRIVDVSIIPFMRAATILVSAKGMRPNVRVYPFFDGTDVSSYCTGTMTTDSEGNIGPITFSLPAGVFKTGERIFRLIDVSTNVVADCSTSAEKVYRAQGLLKTEESTIVSTRNLVVHRESVTDERIFNNVTTREIISNSYGDPTAQTFLIDPITYPSGMFVSSIDLFFKTKASTLPVSLQIRPTVNGYPHSASIVPFSEITKSASAVSVSDDGTTATNFRFTTPIFLQPGEYAIVVISNSNDYELWVSEVGQPDIVSGELITSQPYPGSFFKSQNSCTWTAEQSLDLKFKINKCLFDTTGGAVSFSFDETNYYAGVTGIATFSNGANIFKVNSTYIEPANTGISTTIQFETGGSLNTAVPILNNQNYTFAAKQPIANSNTNTIQTNFTMSSSVSDVSPVLDAQRVSGLYIQNLVNRFNTDSYKDLYETLPSVRGITSDTSNLGIVRYLSRKINLQEGFESNSVDVYLTARLPLNSDIRAYIKSQSPTDNTVFENLPYEPLQVHTDYSIAYGSATGSSRYVSVGEDDYVDLRFTRGGTGVTRTSGTTGQTEFKSFQVKVVLYGDADNSVVPAFKDFKVIAT